MPIDHCMNPRDPVPELSITRFVSELAARDKQVAAVATALIVVATAFLFLSLGFLKKKDNLGAHHTSYAFPCAPNN